MCKQDNQNLSDFDLTHILSNLEDEIPSLENEDKCFPYNQASDRHFKQCSPLQGPDSIESYDGERTEYNVDGTSDELPRGAGELTDTPQPDIFFDVTSGFD